MIITSKENPVIKRWRQLNSDGRFRRKQGAFACEGARLCQDAALSDISIEAVLFTEKAKETYPLLLEPVLMRAKTFYEITPQLATFLSDTTSPQGIFCIGKMPENTLSPTEMSPTGRYLALEDMQDPANLGAVIRTAEALGVSGILLSDGCCDLYSPKVLRSSMGGVFRLPFAVVHDFSAHIPVWKEQGIRTFACVPDRSATPVQQAHLPGGGICLIGNEGNGLKTATVAACDTPITIPMSGRAESLNAAVAASIVLWELNREG